MSHFTVLVIGDNPEEQLAPFQENNMGDCPSEYLEFHDTEEEYVEKYENGTTRKVVMPDGTLLSPYDEKFRVQGTYGTGSDTHMVPEELEQREVPFREMYPAFEEFMEEYCGYKERDDKTGKYGYWENPNAKWDWYSLGGRWTGFFKVKEGVEDYSAGSPGLMTDEAEPGFADQLRKGDIDIEYMRDETARKAMEEYDFAELLLGHLERNRTWEEVTELHKEDYTKARAFYWSQPRCAVWDMKRKENFQEFPLGFNSSPDDFLVTREEYIQRAVNGAIVPFAVLKDGKWYERGEMGWWGIVSDEKEVDEWNAQVSKMIDELPDDTMLSLYDCHI